MRVRSWLLKLAFEMAYLFFFSYLFVILIIFTKFIFSISKQMSDFVWNELGYVPIYLQCDYFIQFYQLIS